MKPCPYLAYYSGQAGSGIGATVFKGSPYQRGHGVGSFFSGLFRSIMPLIRRGVGTVGKEALRTGVNILGDLQEKRPIKEIFKTRISEAGGNLKRKAENKIDTILTGSGYKKKRKAAKRIQSHTPRARAKNTKKKRLGDIFD